MYLYIELIVYKGNFIIFATADILIALKFQVIIVSTVMKFVDQLSLPEVILF